MTADFTEVKDKFRKLVGYDNFKVTFVKKNGERRVMKATMNFDFYVPEEIMPKPKTEEELDEKKRKEISDPHVTVWDLDKKAFRKINLTTLEGDIELLKDEEV